MRVTVLCDDEEEARTVMNGYRWRAVVTDLRTELRSILKHDASPELDRSAIGWVWDKLHDTITANGVSLDD